MKSIYKFISNLIGNRKLTICDLAIEVGKLELRPGDIVLLTCARPLRHTEAQALREAWDSAFPGQKAVVIEPGMTAEVRR